MIWYNTIRWEGVFYTIVCEVVFEVVFKVVFEVVFYTHFVSLRGLNLLSNKAS